MKLNPRWNLATATASLLAILGSTGALANDTSRYGYFSVVHGKATVTQVDDRVDVEANYPLMTGDQLWTSYGSRVEAILPDSTVVRVGDNSVINFDRLAFAADRSSDGTLLFLDKGELVVTVPRDTVGAAQTRIDTPNATVYLIEPGTYRLESHGYVTQLIVRSGSAELLTQDESVAVNRNEKVSVTGSSRTRVQLSYAPSHDALERWGDELDRLAHYDSGSSYVDRSLGYSSASLNRHGNWHVEASVSFWRPRVSTDWAPYRNGRWVYSPSGMTWVASEPWGWVPHHYGNWDRHHRYGWVWYPGKIYRPAWVYWYWGNDRVGWCPTGYYTRYYSRSHYRRPHHDLRFSIGVHGWAGGHSRNYRHWTFVGSDRVYDRDLRHHLRGNHHRRDDVIPRGLITTDTRGLRPETVRQPRAAVEVLQHGPSRNRASRRDLPDLSDFVARKEGTPRNMVSIAMPIDEPTTRGAISRPDRRSGNDDLRTDRSRTDRPRTGDADRGPVATDRGRTRDTQGVRSATGGPSRADTVRPDRGARSRVSDPKEERLDRVRSTTGGQVTQRPTSDRTTSRTVRDRATPTDRSQRVRSTTGGEVEQRPSPDRTPSRTVRDRRPSGDSSPRVRSTTGGQVTQRPSTDRSPSRTVREREPEADRSNRTRTRSTTPRDRNRSTSPSTPERDREIVRRVVEGSRPPAGDRNRSTSRRPSSNQRSGADRGTTQRPPRSTQSTSRPPARSSGSSPRATNPNPKRPSRSTASSGSGSSRSTERSRPSRSRETTGSSSKDKESKSTERNARRRSRPN